VSRSLASEHLKDTHLCFLASVLCDSASPDSTPLLASLFVVLFCFHRSFMLCVMCCVTQLLSPPPCMVIKLMLHIPIANKQHFCTILTRPCLSTLRCHIAKTLELKISAVARSSVAIGRVART
jgi:hypothetical protein